MSFAYLLWYYLWIAPHALLVVLLFVMLRRGLHRKFPLFFAYTLSEVLQFIVLFSVFRAHLDLRGPYLVLSSAGLLLSTALRFGVIYEIFAYLFRNYEVLSSFGKPLFRGVTAVLFLVALILAVFTRSSNPDAFSAGLFLGERTASILQCGLLLALFLCSYYLGLSLRSQVFGIALGLGIVASVALASSALRTEMGPWATSYLDFFTMGTYHACVLVWVFYLSVPERAGSYGMRPPRDADDLDQWSRELQRLIR